MIKFIGDETKGVEVDEEDEVPPEMRTPHLCPTCGKRPRANKTRYGVRFSCCKLWAWGPYPLVDAETHASRKRAHEVFDELWKRGGRLEHGKRVSPQNLRSLAYARLAELLKIPSYQCHMKLMDADTAKMVLILTTVIKGEWRRKGLHIDN